MNNNFQPILLKKNEVKDLQYLSRTMLIPTFKDYDRSRLTIKPLEKKINYFTILNEFSLDLKKVAKKFNGTDVVPFDSFYRELKKDEPILTFYKYDKEDSKQHGFFESISGKNKIEEYQAFKLLAPDDGITSFYLETWETTYANKIDNNSKGYDFKLNFFWSYDDFSVFKEKIIGKDFLKKNKF